MINESASSYQRTNRETRTFVPPLRKKPVVTKANPISYSDADDEDDNDFEVTIG